MNAKTCDFASVGSSKSIAVFPESNSFTRSQPWAMTVSLASRADSAA
jgi:hypothetical protein